MTLFRSFDAAFPPDRPAAGCAAVLGYLGAPGRTPHVWSAVEWNMAGMSHGLYGMGIWVPDLQGDPIVQAVQAADRAKRFGWHSGRGIVLDMETWVDAGFVQTFTDELAAAGYQEVTYGSQSTVLRNPAGAGYWIAAWDGSPVDAGGRELGHQYADEGTFDLSVWESSALGLFGHGPRRVA